MHDAIAADGITLIDVLRSVPILEPHDSLQRFLDILNYCPYSVLPVVDNSRLCGYMHLADVHFLLGIDGANARNATAYQPVAKYMRPATPVLASSATRKDIESVCAGCTQDLVAVVDKELYLFGVVACRDLLIGNRAPLRLPTIGGMATPLGVYLSDGASQAGAGNWALVASGAALGLFFMTATVIIQLAIMGISRISHHDFSFLAQDDYLPPAGDLKLGSMALVAHLATTVVFLLLVRTSRIAGYHAAEHQTVHAVENGEPLVPEVVARMPRPHPRCGTNIMAAGILFWNISALLRALPGFDSDSATLISVIVTFFNWRRFGTFLQAYFTTKPAAVREIESGIAAAKSLAEKYRSSVPSRRRPLRRLWCSGLLQSMVGLVPTTLILSWLLTRLFH